MDPERYQPVADAIRERVPASGAAPVLVGIGGPVCVGKSTTSAYLRELLHPISVEVVTTDGFLYSNAELDRRGLTHAKGFPQSYDVGALDAFLAAARTGTGGLSVPTYSHETYDLVPDTSRELTDAVVLIVEGVNVLWFRPRLDLGVYVDAPEAAIEHWYSDRLVGVFAAAPAGSFYATLGLDEAQQRQFAAQIWAGINHVNLVENIAPTRAHAEIVVEKGADHRVVRVRFSDGVAPA